MVTGASFLLSRGHLVLFYMIHLRRSLSSSPPITGLDIQKNFSKKMLIFSSPSVLTYVLGAHKNRLIETVLLSTHNICFG